MSWDEAIEFCDRLSAKMGTHYTLPSEAQWEYACRAGTTTPFYFGQTLTDELANYSFKIGSTTPVGQFPANAFGLYDMHGNVWEWCADHWHRNYDGAPIDGSAWTENGNAKRRMLRGGSWGNDPMNCRSAYRNWDNRYMHDDVVGFRLLLAPQDSFIVRAT